MSEIVSSLDTLETEFSENPWADCRFLTCSLLPVRMACNLSCKFCFSKSSISTLEQDGTRWTELQLERYFAFSRSRGASRLVITGGGEPLLRADAVRTAVRVGGQFFSEIALFTNGVLLNRSLIRELVGSGALCLYLLFATPLCRRTKPDSHGRCDDHFGGIF